MRLEPDEALAAVAPGEAVGCALAMLPGALRQVRGDAGVDRAVFARGHDVYGGLLHGGVRLSVRVGRGTLPVVGGVGPLRSL